MSDFISQITSWVTTGGSTGDIADYPENIRAYVDREFENFGQLFTDTSEIPPEFEARAAVFSNPYDLAAYLANGGLILEGSGGIEPNPIVGVLKIPTGFADEDYEYQVYIGPSE